MSLAEFLNQLPKPTQFEWVDMSTADFSKVREGLTDAIKYYQPKYKETHPKVIDQLTHYLMRSDKFQGDLNKGLILLGTTGTGKTLMLSAFALMMKYIHRKVLKIRSGIELEQIMRENADTMTSFKYTCFGIDDLGEEHDSVKVYGTEIHTGIELLTLRHKEFMNKGSLTFCTTNLDRTRLAEKYGARIDSRIDEMFNIIPVVGKDHRR
jgi:DNA replication protein DnaC